MKRSQVIICAVNLSWIVFTGCMIFSNHRLKLELEESKAVIERLRENISVLRFSNYSYEQYFQKKVADGEMIEVISVEK